MEEKKRMIGTMAEENLRKKGNILPICGDEDVMRHVYKNHGFGYWSAAFETLLEKHGFLDFEKATQNVLDRSDVLKNYDFLIIRDCYEKKTENLTFQKSKAI